MLDKIEEWVKDKGEDFWVGFVVIYVLSIVISLILLTCLIAEGEPLSYVLLAPLGVSIFLLCLVPLAYSDCEGGVEASASGCTLVKFQKTQETGVESFKIHPAQLIDQCIKAPERFWEAVKEII